MLTAKFTSQFQRDAKRLKKKHVELEPLYELVDLVILNTPDAISELKRRHRMHTLAGEWAGSKECHVANAGDWLVVWSEGNGIAAFQRTGSHKEFFK